MDDYVAEIFNEHLTSFPRAFQRAKPLNDGMGANGFIIELSNGNLVKLFDRQEDKDMWKAQYKVANETSALEVLEKENFPAPRLFGPAHAMPNRYAWCAYVMTRVPGTAPAWHHLFKDDPVRDVKRQAYAEEAGRLLAQFHAATLLHKDKFYKLPGVEEDFTDIPEIPVLGPDANLALREIETYLKEKAQSGIVHGDFHSRNIMVGDDGKLTGLIDFEHTGPSTNIYVDFCNLPAEMLPGVTKGYEAQSGKPFDQILLDATRLSIITQSYVSGPNDEHTLQRLFKILDRLEPLTGFSGNPKQSSPQTSHPAP